MSNRATAVWADVHRCCICSNDDTAVAILGGWSVRGSSLSRVYAMTSPGGQAMVAYACCVKRGVASAGPLSEHNSAFDIRAVRERIEGDRVNEEATRLIDSLRPSGARGGGEARPAASPGPAPLPPWGEARARSPPRSAVNDRRTRGGPNGQRVRDGVCDGENLAGGERTTSELSYDDRPSIPKGRRLS